MDKGVEAPPKSRVVWGLGVAIVLLLAGGFMMRFLAPRPEAVPAAGVDAAVVEVRAFVVTKERRRDRVALPAIIEAKRSVRLASETEGRVLVVSAEALDRVDAEQHLVQIDPLRARVAVERARAAVTRATSELGLAKTSLERQQSLKERAVTSESALDDASNQSRVAESSLRDARAQLEAARDDLAKKTIRAPFAGVLRSFEVEAGEYVRMGQELGELLDVSAARVILGLSDRQITTVKAGEPIELTAEAYPNRRFDGEILRVGAASDRSKKFPVEVEFDNSDGALLPGMIVRVHLDLADAQDRVFVPREALASEYGRGFVYVLKDGVAMRRDVSVRELPFDPSRVEILNGLSGGERVAVSGVRLLTDGARARVRGAPSPAVAAPAPGSASADAGPS